MVKCVVCNKDFELIKENRYTSRDEGRKGISAIAGGSEETLYDTFDCPYCGCQNVMQKRRRSYINIKVAEEECVTESDFEEVEENDDSTVAVEKVYAVEHSNCFGKYDENDITCLSCNKKRSVLLKLNTFKT